MAYDQASLDNYFRVSSVGGQSRPIGDNMYGINHLKAPTRTELSKRSQGFVFFTRPLLNLQEENIQNSGFFYPLLKNDPYSVQRYIRCLLDPRIAYGFGIAGNKYKLECPLLDNELIFMALATNTCKTITGWPEKVTPTTTSDENDFGVSHVIADGINDLNGVYDLTATFSSIYTDPLMRVFSYLQQYMSDVRRGVLQPYIDAIIEDYLDYTLGIYRFTMDRTRTIITDMAQVSKAIPQNDPTAKIFDYNHALPYSESPSEFTISFKAEGIYYNDPIIVRNFNDAVSIGKPAMSDDERHLKMKQIPQEMSPYFNFRGYPHINTATNELEWWVDAADYEYIVTAINGRPAFDEDYDDLTQGETI